MHRVRLGAGDEQGQPASGWPVAAAVYFSVAEALANAAKHAHARSVRIGLSHASGMLRAEVTDDGLRTALRARGQVPGLPVLVLSRYVEQL